MCPFCGCEEWLAQCDCYIAHRVCSKCCRQYYNCPHCHHWRGLSDDDDPALTHEKGEASKCPICQKKQK